MKGSTFLSLVGVGVIMLLIGIALGSASPPTTITQIQTLTVSIPTNSDFTTQTMNCSGVPVCGLSSAYVYTNSITTVIIFEYPSSNTTSDYALTLTHPTTCNTTIYENSISPTTGNNLYTISISENSTITFVKNPVVTERTVTELNCS
jgi:hypothetical protein